MVKQKFYFDTSVFGGVFDEGFAEASAMLFERVKLGLIDGVYSSLTELELLRAPINVVTHFDELKEGFLRKVDINDTILSLAETYLAEKVVGKTSRDDCIHIAAATFHKADFLVSWNFKHIVNVYRIRGYNAINLRLGFSPLDIRSPKDIVYGN